jgi:hypothetical protein
MKPGSAGWKQVPSEPPPLKSSVSDGFMFAAVVKQKNKSQEGWASKGQ